MKTKILSKLNGSYACRNCLEYTNRIYTTEDKKIKTIACCPNCAREVIKNIKKVSKS